MITFFCIPKPFTGETRSRQINALRSWQALDVKCEVLVFGDEEGVAGACREVEGRHVPHIARNEQGTPLLDFAFREAQQLAHNKLLCYANSDIVFFPDLLLASKNLCRDVSGPYLAVGQRRGFDAADAKYREGECWSPEIIQREGRMDGVLFIDYFLFTKSLFANIPPFAVGRPGWDNWMIYEARIKQIPVIDLTAKVLAGHQDHDHKHTAEGLSGGRDALWCGLEAQKNRRLAGGHMFGVDDATHHLDESGSLVLRVRPFYFWHRLREAHEIFPRWRWVLLLLWKLVLAQSKMDRQIRLFLLRRGVDLFPNKEKRHSIPK